MIILKVLFVLVLGGSLMVFVSVGVVVEILVYCL